MTPLVLLHGFMGGSAQWTAQITGLKSTGPLVFIDLPGFGANSHMAPIKKIEHFAEWVIADLRDKGISRYALVGHSMGGMIAQEIAIRDARHIDKLVLYSTGSLGVLPGRFESIETSKMRVIREGTSVTSRRIASTWFLQGENALGYGITADIAASASRDAILFGLDAMQNWSGVKNLKNIKADTLVLWGDRDRTYPWSQIEQLWTTIPDANLAIVPNCAHAVHAEKPEIFNAIVTQFLTE